MLRHRPVALVILVMAVVALGGVPAAGQSASPYPAAASVPAPSPAGDVLRLVVVGDSIPFNSPDDCPGCTSFVDLYGSRVKRDMARPVSVQNLSEHNGLQTDGLLAELASDNVRRDALAAADIIVVSIGFNDAPWNTSLDPCDAGREIRSNQDLLAYPAGCGAIWAETMRPKLESVFGQIAASRGGRPTLMVALDRYNDWIGYAGDLTVSDAAGEVAAEVIDAWNEMLCAAAESNGFLCADVLHRFNGATGRDAAGDLLAADYTHPSQAGNDALAEVLAGLGYGPLAGSSPAPSPGA